MKNIFTILLLLSASFISCDAGIQGTYINKDNGKYFIFEDDGCGYGRFGKSEITICNYAIIGNTISIDLITILGVLPMQLKIAGAGELLHGNEVFKKLNSKEAEMVKRKFAYKDMIETTASTWWKLQYAFYFEMEKMGKTFDEIGFKPIEDKHIISKQGNVTDTYAELIITSDIDICPNKSEWKFYAKKDFEEKPELKCD